MKRQKIFIKIYKATYRILNKNIPLSSLILNFILSQITPYPEKIKTHNGIFYLLPRGKVSRELTLYGVFEKDETELIKNIIHEGDVVVDIGGNIGYYTLILSNIVGKRGKVFSFEPGLENFSILEKNIMANNLQNTVIERLAISDVSSKTKLYLAEGPGGHKIHHSNFCTKNFDVVNSITLDEYYKNNSLRNEIKFIKIDVEGAEFNVLRGMESLLKNEGLKILLEIYGPFIREFGHEPIELFTFLRKNNFKIYSIKKLDLKKPFTSDNLLELKTHEENKLNYEWKDQNFLCIKQK